MFFSAEQLLKWALHKIDIFDAEILLAHLLQKTREFILTHPEYRVAFFIGLKFKYFVWQRKRGKPLAYIIGHKEFFGLDFLVNNKTLIPRPDTEMMVEQVLSELKIVNCKLKIALVDVGTGSGCIPISILKTFKQLNRQTIKQTNIKTFAMDISKGALKIAKKNAKKYSVDIKFLHGDLLEPFLKQCNNEAMKQFDNLIIMANLPYGWKKWKNNAFAEKNSLKYEPAVALFTGKNGLELYEKLLNQIINSEIYNLQSTIFLEFDPRQTEELTELINKILPKAKLEIKKDLAGQDRLMIVKYDHKLN